MEGHEPCLSLNIFSMYLHSNHSLALYFIPISIIDLSASHDFRLFPLPSSVKTHYISKTPMRYLCHKYSLLTINFPQPLLLCPYLYFAPEVTFFPSQLPTSPPPSLPYWPPPKLSFTLNTLTPPETILWPSFFYRKSRHRIEKWPGSTFGI